MDVLGPENAPLLTHVMQQGRANSRTLGFLPEGAYEERAALGQLLVATDHGGLLGYLLYRVSRRRAVIIHLCVAAEQRGRGVARELVNKLCKVTSHLDGISLRCRTDYAENAMWPKLSFRKVNEIAARSGEGNTLSCWWMGFGKPDLFTVARTEEDAALDVVLDQNVWLQVAGLARTIHDGLAAGPDARL